MKTLLISTAGSRWYWVFILVSGLSFEAVALYYQYVLDEWPCVLCIHVRIWIAAIIVISAVALISKSTTWSARIFHLLITLASIGFVERSWQTLAIERGWIFGDCSMDSGLPDWFALDRWIPFLFEVKTTCGYTPYIILQISMAEILMLTSVVLLLLSLSLFAASWFKPAANA